MASHAGNLPFLWSPPARHGNEIHTAVHECCRKITDDLSLLKRSRYAAVLIEKVNNPSARRIAAVSAVPGRAYPFTLFFAQLKTVLSTKNVARRTKDKLFIIKLPDFEDNAAESAEYLQRKKRNNNQAYVDQQFRKASFNCKDSYAFKRRKTQAKKTRCGFAYFLFDLIIETENLGPVLLRLERKAGFTVHMQVGRNSDLSFQF